MVRWWQQGKRPLLLVLLGMGIAIAWTLATPTLATPPTSLADTHSTPSLRIAQLDPLQQGRDFYAAGRYADAAKAWELAAQQFAQQGDRTHQAMALSNLSLAYQQLGQWSQATAAINQALALSQATTGDPKAWQAVRAQALNTQGSLYLATGRPDQALTAWEQATTTYRAIADTDRAIQSQINQVQALKALGLYRRAVTLLTTVNQTLQQQPASVMKAAGLRSLGDTLRLIGDLKQSETTLQQSLRVAESIASPAETATTWLSLGNTWRTQNRPNDALRAYQQAATLTPSPALKVQAQLNQLSFLVEQKDVVAAQTLWNDLQPRLAMLPVSHTSVFAHINAAQTLMRGNHSPTAIAPLLSTAIQQAQTLGDQRAQSYALGTLGNLYERNQQWSDARTVTEQALLIAQAINAADITYQWQWQLGRILNAQAQTPAAIAAYTQSVNTLQTLRNDLVAINTDVQFSFRESVEPVYRELVDLLVEPDASGETSQANLVQARRVIESLQLAELDNFFREACLQGEPVPIERVDPTAAIIYPIILSDRLEVILSIAGQPLRHYSTAITPTQVEQTIARLRASLSPLAPSRDRYRLPKIAYDWLVKPGEADLTQNGVKTLVFILDGPLRNFPMSALYDGSKFLVEKYNIALTPGLQLLDPRPLARQDLKALTGGLTEARQEFSALPGVANELKQISNMIPSQLLLDQDLTNANLEKLLATVPFNVVHLATHGQFSSNADETFILTWDNRLKVKQLSDLLRTREGATKPLEMLVLSACQTASGDNRAALGLAGVAVRSGARSTVATLWSVNDEAAAAMMTGFYEALRKPGITKSEALRQAQLTLLQDPKFRLPYYWAPFVLVGNWL